MVQMQSGYNCFFLVFWFHLHARTFHTCARMWMSLYLTMSSMLVFDSTAFIKRNLSLCKCANRFFCIVKRTIINQCIVLIEKICMAIFMLFEKKSVVGLYFLSFNINFACASSVTVLSNRWHSKCPSNFSFKLFYILNELRVFAVKWFKSVDIDLSFR